MSTTKTLPEALRELRGTQGLSQEALAERLSVTTRSVINYEQGKRVPSVAVLHELAEALGADVRDLVMLDPGRVS